MLQRLSKRFSSSASKLQLSPTIDLNNGIKLPLLGLGTFGSDHQSGDKIASGISLALDLGYRHFDCAPAYQNHSYVGKAVKEGLERYNLSRDDIIIGSKLGNDGHSKDDVKKHCFQTLKELDMDYIDIYMIHWAWPNFHPPGCDSDFINPTARPYIHELYMETYTELEKLFNMGAIKSVAVSNMTVPKMKLLLKDCNINPAVNQVELHPHFQQQHLVKYHLEETDVKVVGYMPMGSPNRPERDVFPEHTVDLADPVLIEISNENGWTVGQTALKFNMQRGVALIPQTATPSRLEENLKAANLPNLTKEQMDRLLKIDKNCRLIRGQVFSWKQGQDWHDLWDDLGDETWNGPINGTSANEPIDQYV
eukprot:308816_1